MKRQVSLLAILFKYLNTLNWLTFPFTVKFTQFSQTKSLPVIKLNSVFFLFTLFFFQGLIKANNIQVNNVSLTGQNTTEDYTLVQFDLEWENSWRTSGAPNNWDAAWIFVKYRINPIGAWQHAKLNINGHTGPSGSVVQMGLVDENAVFDNSSNPAVGAFIYRNETGSGTFSLSGVKLRWNYGANGLADNDIVDVKVFAIEMVYVSPGIFNIGSGGGETSSFYRYPTTTNTYQVLSESAITVGTGTDNLYYASSTFGGDSNGPIPALFPKGYMGFYSMKYEISQQQYVDFLNHITATQAAARFANNNSARNGITVSSGVYSTTLPYVSVNYLSWGDAAAFADWTGLRPMSELEFEKGCRGSSSPVPLDYAWGSSSITQATGISNSGANNELASNTGANAVYGAHPNVQGPLRVGSFSNSTSTRSQAGASYWGIMELSGNLWEWTVTAGNSTGRSFTSIHGDGLLSTNGHGNTTTWPGMVSGEITGTTGTGVRGGGWTSSPGSLRVSDREYAAEAATGRGHQRGFRAVRAIPYQDFVCGASLIKDIDNNYYNTVQIGSQCWLKDNLKVTKNPQGTAITRYCYNNNPVNCDLYGGLYTWTTMMNGSPSSNGNPSGVQGICPTGWHVPSETEMIQLVDFLGGAGISGGKLKSDRTSPTPDPSWAIPNSGATNESNFSALPIGGYYVGSFQWQGYYSHLWTSTELDISFARLVRMDYDSDDLQWISSQKFLGLGIRCLKD